MSGLGSVCFGRLRDFKYGRKLFTPIINNGTSGKDFMLARNLKRLIEEKGISYNELARRSGVPKTNLLNWSEGANPQVDQLLRVADVLEVSLDYLVASRKEETDLDKILDKVSMHVGLYEVSIKKVSKK